MMFEKRKKGIIAIIALLLAAFIAGGVFSVSAKYTSKLDSTSTYVQVSLKLDPNYTSAPDSEWRTVSPVNGQPMPSVTPPARDGYIFTGYYSEDGTPGHEQSDANRYYKNDGTSYKNWDASCNVLYAGWEGSFRITFDAGTNHGTIAGSSDTQRTLFAKNGESVLYSDNTTTTTVPAPGASCDGMRFDGWFTEADGGAEVINENGTLLASTLYTDASCKWNLTSSVTLYAQYSAYKITFDAGTNGGTIKDSTETQTALYAKNGASTLYTTKKADVTASAPRAEYSDKDHYYFDGWYTAASDGIKKIDYDGTVLLPFSGLTDDNTVLYAQYKPYTYVVTFDKNEPTGQTVHNNTGQWTRIYGETGLELTENKFTCTGSYKFMGWAIAASYASRFTDKQRVTVTDLLNAGVTVSQDPSDRTRKNITLYARWNRKNQDHTVTFINTANGYSTTYHEYNGKLYTSDRHIFSASIPAVGHSERSGSYSYWCNTSTINDSTEIIVNDGALLPNTMYTDSAGNWDIDRNIELYCLWYTVNYYKDTGVIEDDSYTELEYIASTGGQYINTGVRPGNYNSGILNLRFAMRPSSLTYSTISSDNFYSFNDSDYDGVIKRNQYSFCNEGFRSDCYWLIGHRTLQSDYHLFSHNLTTGVTTKYDITYDNRQATHAFTAVINNPSPLPEPINYTEDLPDNNLLFFSKTANSGFSSYRLYYLEINGNESSVRDFVPARDSNGIIGLYDKSENAPNVFYPSNSSSSFVTESYNQVFVYGENSGTLNGYNVSGNAADRMAKEGYSKSGANLIGWSYSRPSIRPADFNVSGDNVNPTLEFKSYIKGDYRNQHVDLYSVWSDSQELTASFINMNKATEYYYLAPIDDDGNIIEEEN